jgi:hypothetical protein
VGSAGGGREPSRRLPRVVVAGLLLLGAYAYGLNLWHPLDGRTRELWREADVAGIARNYAQEGMHLLYPQIDWRGTGPGYVEMEFPIYPYAIAIGYKLFGYHEVIGRLISYALVLGALLLFLRLAEYTMPPPAAAAATVFFAVNPIAARVATTIQPEGLMLFCYVGAVYAFVRWLDDDRWWWYGWAAALTAGAILAKIPAAHVGLVFVLFAVWRRGWRVFLRPRVWALAVLALIPPLLWYAHARTFWLTYGNSLGASNSHHFAGLATFTDSESALGIDDIELQFIWSYVAWIALAVALALGPWLPVFGYGLLWYVGVLIFYLVIAKTSSALWATYYHVVSVPPAGLLFGGIVAVIGTRLQSLDRRHVWRALASAIGGLAVGGLLELVLPGAGRITVGVIAIAVVLVALAIRVWPRSAAVAASDSGIGGPFAIGVLVLVAGLAPISLLRQTLREAHPVRWEPEYATARAFAPLIPPGVLIMESGGYCQGPTESAYEEPWYLYWTNHKGFVPCVQDHTMSVVHDLRAKGARYFIAERYVMAQRHGFEKDMRREFQVIAETPIAVLFKLDPRP